MGLLAETFVAQWLSEQGWIIRYRRWRCRWGELDLVVSPHLIGSHSSVSLVFVEVKARQDGNWDKGGLLAITPQKQAKLWRTAELFLAAHPQFADYPCRFDVALVHCQRQRSKGDRSTPTTSIVAPGAIEPVGLREYCLTLHHYIPGAFGQ